MMYFTSDLHHQHKRICELTGRKHVTKYENHTQWLIDLVNKRVTNSDQLYLLGDISFSRKFSDVADFYSQLNGQKFVIKGNHDDRTDAAAELRRLYAQCDELLAALESIVNFMFADFDDLPMANRVRQVIAKAKGETK